MALTRGIRNNNPANIRRSASKWLGLAKYQLDKKFCQFTEMSYGIRAFFIIMRTYRYKYNCKSPRSILTRFAPASENDLDAYLRFIESKGLPADVEFTSNAIYCIFAKYVFIYESKYSVSCAFLNTVMDELKCYVINDRKECQEQSLF